MKISILVFNLSDNCLVRTYPIAKVLERHYKIEIIGPLVGKEIFKPYRSEFYYKPVLIDYEFPKFSMIKKGMLGIKELVNNISGNIIYAFKPRVTSFGIGLLAKYIKKIPLILDIEDWESAPFYDSSFRSTAVSLKKFYDPNNTLYTCLMGSVTKFADEITVVSNFLQDRFGGIKLPHGADTNFFNPSRYNAIPIREQLNLSNEKIIMFCGTPREHKGLEELLLAIKSIGRKDVKLIIVGGDRQKPYVEKLFYKSSDNVIITGYQPHSRMPEFLSIADLIVLPQRKSLVAMAQIPGKVFEAMAMARPIIATSVSDLPEILDGCGWIVEPENPEQLKEAIQYVLNNPEEAGKMGRKARQKCIEKYSWDAMEKILVDLFRKYG